MTELAVHGYAAARTRRRRRSRSGPVQAASVHPGAWRLAVTLARGDHRRLRVQSPTEVLVLNQPGRPLAAGLGRTAGGGAAAGRGLR